MFESFRQTLTAIVDLDASELEYLFPRLTVKHLPREHFLVKEGSVCNFIAFVDKGALRTFLSKEGREVNTEFFMESSFACAFTSFLEGKPTALTIQAIEDSTLFLLPKLLLEELYQRNPRWLALGKYIFEQEFVKKCRRESSFLQEDAPSRYLTLLKQYPQLEKRVSLQHISSYLGIQPETLSRIRSGKLPKN